MVKKRGVLDKDFLEKNSYKLKDEKLLGKGGCGEVVKVCSIKTGKTFAMKIIKIGKANGENKKRVFREVEILSKYRHPFLATLTSHFFSEDHSILYIVMKYYEYCKIKI